MSMDVVSVHVYLALSGNEKLTVQCSEGVEIAQSTCTYCLCDFNSIFTGKRFKFEII